ncbi:MAG: hypothetical protein AAGI17_07225 [Planctomycetota bacterium]
MSTASPTQTVSTLISGLIDYAGLFPPAKLPMADAVAEYHRRLVSEDHAALGSFICAASRLEELTEHGRVLMPGTYATSGYREMAGPGMGEPWSVSVVVDIDLSDAIDAIDAFNERHASEDQGLASIRALEVRMPTPAFVDDALEVIPSDIRPFFEIPQELVLKNEDPRGYVAALAGNDGCCSKIRCGGVKPELIPPAEAIARFIVACDAAHVPFKATAGLHHPIRAAQPLTYDDNPPHAMMHGFVNVFVAAAMVKARLADESRCVEILLETDPKAFGFTNDAVTWRDVTLPLIELAKGRERFALGYGSCSFAEPMDDLRKLGLL